MMNALVLKTALPRAVAARRTVSSAAMNLKKSNTLANNWFSDMSTYPIIAILTAATVGCTGFMAYKFTFCEDVRVSSKTKGKVLRE